MIGGEDAGGTGPTDVDDETADWIEIRVFDDQGNALAGQNVTIRLPDGSIANVVTGEDGTVELAGLVPGDCQVALPGVPDGAWQVL